MSTKYTHFNTCIKISLLLKTYLLFMRFLRERKQQYGGVVKDHCEALMCFTQILETRQGFNL